MESWAIIPVAAIVMWGLVQIFRARSIAAGSRRRDREALPDDAGMRTDLEDLRRRVLELEERQDFTERVLTKGSRAGEPDGRAR